MAKDLTILGDFAGADDILHAANNGTLTQYDTVCVARGGRIGPPMEILMAKRAFATKMLNVSLETPFAKHAGEAISMGRVSGTTYRAKFGIFPLSRGGSPTSGSDEWVLWCSRAEQAATAIAFPRPLAAAIIGALIELQENVLLHSQRPQTGLVAYGATKTHFEVVVADAGVGVLSSLRRNPVFEALNDAGTALMTAVADGNSRFGSEQGRGFGMGQMFRALANHDGELRFRSDDAALSIRGHSPSLSGTIELGHKARLPGLVVSVRCPAPGATDD